MLPTAFIWFCSGCLYCPSLRHSGAQLLDVTYPMRLCAATYLQLCCTLSYAALLQPILSAALLHPILSYAALLPPYLAYHMCLFDCSCVIFSPLFVHMFALFILCDEVREVRVLAVLSSSPLAQCTVRTAWLGRASASVCILVCSASAQSPNFTSADIFVAVCAAVVVVWLSSVHVVAASYGRMCCLDQSLVHCLALSRSTAATASCVCGLFATCLLHY